MLLNTLRITAKYLQLANTSRITNLRSVAQGRKYSEFVHRRPVRIVNEEEILEKVEEAEGPNEFYEENARKPLKARRKKKNLRKEVVTKSDTLFKEDGELNFTELKENDHVLTKLMMSVRSKKIRDRNSRIILEGHRLITDAIEAGSIPEIVVFSRAADVQKLPLPKVGVKLYKTPYRAIQTWSTLTTAPGVMGFFTMPDVENIKPATDALPLTIICDNVREPGNLGSILRACAAVGCKRLILVKGCVDLWDPKVLRSAAGAHFHMPIFATRTWKEVRKMIDLSAYVYVADNQTFVSTEEVEEEADETSEEEEEEAEIMNEDELIERKIQMKGSGDSPEILSKYNIESVAAEDKLYRSVIDDETEFKNHHQRKKEAKIAATMVKNIPIIPYYATNYTTSENIIIIGGETEGVSLDALALVHERSGVRVNIPMSNGIDSLNTGMALGIIAFEMKRQFLVDKSNKSQDPTT